MGFELSQLETFLAVAEERSFSRAAKRMHRTQPAISQTIRKLESELGETLFDRSAKDGQLTAAGEVLLQYSGRLLNLRGEAVNAMAELRALHTGRLALAANEYTSLYLLPVLNAYRQRAPEIKVSVRRSLASRIADHVQMHDVELGVLSFVPADPQLRSVVVYEDPLVFTMSPRHPLARRKEVSIRELGGESFVAHNVPSPLRQVVVDTFQKHRTALNMDVELPSLDAIKRLVAMGSGVAFLPELVAHSELESGELVAVKVRGVNISRKLRVVYRKRAVLSYAAAAFLEVIEAISRERGGAFRYEAVREKTNTAQK